MRGFFAAGLMAAMLAGAGAAPAGAAEISLLTSGAFKPVVMALLPIYERQSGNKVTVANDTAGALVRRIEGGERFDLVILTPPTIAQFIAKGVVAAGSATDLAKVGIGVAVRQGAPRPDIATVEAFKQTLLAAPSIAYIDPAAGGSSGIYLAQLFEKMAIADKIAPKAVLVPGGLVAARLVSGEAQLAIHQISEILAVPGADLVGPLPEAIQNYTIYTGGIGATSAQPDTARALLAVLAGPDAVPVLREKGMLAPAH